MLRRCYCTKTWKKGGKEPRDASGEECLTGNSECKGPEAHTYPPGPGNSWTSVGEGENGWRWDQREEVREVGETGAPTPGEGSELDQSLPGRSGEPSREVTAVIQAGGGGRGGHA